jgi:hypothetical protein
MLEGRIQLGGILLFYVVATLVCFSTLEPVDTEDSLILTLLVPNDQTESLCLTTRFHVHRVQVLRMDQNRYLSNHTFGYGTKTFSAIKTGNENGAIFISFFFS